jgi:hypothetical protein
MQLKWLILDILVRINNTCSSLSCHSNFKKLMLDSNSGFTKIYVEAQLITFFILFALMKSFSFIYYFFIIILLNLKTSKC